MVETRRSSLRRSSLILARAANPASADWIMLDFEQADLVGDTIGDPPTGLGITFEGRLFDRADIEGYDVVVPTVRDLRGLRGGDHDVEAIPTGFGLVPCRSASRPRGEPSTGSISWSRES